VARRDAGAATRTFRPEGTNSTMHVSANVRRSDRVLPVLGLLVLLVAATWLDGLRLRRQRWQAAERNVRLAADLRLTDLSLFADAPWLRHLAVADALGSIQDGPGAFDYSRGGSLVGPPTSATSHHAAVAEPTALPR